MVDDQEFDGAFGGFELQAELLDGGKYGRARCVAGRRGVVAAKRVSGRGAVEDRFQMEIEESREAGFIADGAVQL